MELPQLESTFLGLTLFVRRPADIVPDEVAAQLLRHTFVEEDAHEGSILGDRKKPFPGLGEQLMHLRFGDRREVREKIGDGMTDAFDICR
jgi:hypothetical protein